MYEKINRTCMRVLDTLLNSNQCKRVQILANEYGQKVGYTPGKCNLIAPADVCGE